MVHLVEADSKQTLSVESILNAALGFCKVGSEANPTEVRATNGLKPRRGSSLARMLCKECLLMSPLHWATVICDDRSSPSTCEKRYQLQIFREQLLLDTNAKNSSTEGNADEDLLHVQECCHRQPGHRSSQKTPNSFL